MNGLNSTYCQAILNATFSSTFVGSTFTGNDPRKGWRIPLNEIKYNEQRDEETGYGYFGARYMDHELMTMWLSVDPKADKYPGLSPYNYCVWNRPTGGHEHRLIKSNLVNNPVKLVDPDGREFGDYYDKNGKWLFSDGRNDGKIYVEDAKNGIFMGPYKQPLFRYVGTVKSIELSFTGNADNSKLNSGADVSESTGTLSVIQNGSDGNAYTRFSIDATSGGYGNESLENGAYTVNHGRRRSAKEEPGYALHGFGFSLDIIPHFVTQRTNLRIHPDGNKRGTLGCIGLNAELSVLMDFYDTLRNYNNNYSTTYNHNGQSEKGLLLTVNINNNVNNNGSKPNRVNQNE